jgi:hypothetical protein
VLARAVGAEDAFDAARAYRELLGQLGSGGTGSVPLNHIGNAVGLEPVCNRAAAIGLDVGLIQTRLVLLIICSIRRTTSTSGSTRSPRFE